jgi:hypothetical protein
MECESWEELHERKTGCKGLEVQRERLKGSGYMKRKGGGREREKKSIWNNI